MVKKMTTNYSAEWQKLEKSQAKTIEDVQEMIPVRVGEIAKRLGLIVKAATLPTGISGEIAPSEESQSGFKIRINRHEAKTRQRFTLAHEIAHFLLHKDQIGDGISDSILYRSNLSDTREAEANRLAADILMPRSKLNELATQVDHMETNDRVDTLARGFNVSRPALEIRLGLLK